MSVSAGTRIAIGALLISFLVPVFLAVTVARAYGPTLQTTSVKPTIKEGGGPYVVLGRLYCSDKEGFICNNACGQAPTDYCCSLCYDPETNRSFCNSCPIWV